MADIAPFVIFALCWLGCGVFGARMAYRGSIKRYRRGIYGFWLYAMTIFFGPVGAIGSMVAW